MSNKTNFHIARPGGEIYHGFSIPTHIKVCGTNKGEYDCSYNGKVTYCTFCKRVVTNSNWNTEECPSVQKPTVQRLPVYQPRQHQSQAQHQGERKFNNRIRPEPLFPRRLDESLKLINETTILAAGEAALNASNEVNRNKLIRMVKHAVRTRDHWIKIAEVLTESTNKIKGLSELIAKDKSSDDNAEENTEEPEESSE